MLHIYCFPSIYHDYFWTPRNGREFFLYRFIDN